MRCSPFITATLLGTIGALAGCAPDTERYPSLAPRAIEKLGFAEPETKTMEATPDPALDAAITDRRSQLGTVATDFATAAAKSETTTRAARGQAVGSDAWLDAQSSLAVLDDYRARMSSLAIDVDTVIRDRAAQLAPVHPGLAALRDDVQAEAEKEGATIDRLQATLPPD